MNAAQRARLGRSNHGNHQEPQLDPTPVIASDISVDDISDDKTSDDENELCSWPGGVNNHLQIESELSEENWLDLPVDMEGGCFNTEEEDHDGQSEEEDEDLYEQEDEELRNSLEESIIHKARAGHLCIFLPKFHCELNFIEFFWGATKKWLRDHCDYTFQTLKANLPSAMGSVKLKTIRLWEHRMVRWMAAYSSGLSARDSQKRVKDFSSRKYTSHRRVPETLAHQFDA